MFYLYILVLPVVLSKEEQRGKQIATTLHFFLPKLNNVVYYGWKQGLHQGSSLAGRRG